MSATETPASGPASVPPEAPRVVLPDLGTVFQRRAERLTRLSAEHGMAPWLQLMAALAQAQQEALPARTAQPVGEQALQHSREHGMPPLSGARHARDPQWRDDLDALATRLAAVPAAAAMVAAATALDADAREALADRIVAGDTLDADAAAVPLVGAALQVSFARAAAALEPSDVARFDTAAVCPVCATRPQASVVQIAGTRDKLRYLVCALCSTEWHLTRIQCSACLSEKSVHYLALTSVTQAEDPAFAATPAGKADEEAASESAAEQARRAEACDECKSYLKIFYRDKDQHVDAMADDLASLALDVAVSERGYDRSGPNLLLHLGASE